MENDDRGSENDSVLEFAKQCEDEEEGAVGEIEEVPAEVSLIYISRMQVIYELKNQLLL